MEYHEVGEKFEYYGVILEVTEARYCKDCFFLGKLGRCILESPMYCGSNTRVDNKRISYKRVEQCKTKDMEQKTEFMVASADKVFATHVGNIQSDEEIYGSLLDKLFSMYKSNITDYGSEFAEMFDELGIDYAYGKLREKMNRIKVLRDMSNIEGLEDALLDMAGYAILTLVELKKRNNGRD